jgi:Rha family phage regulatory protein
MQDLTIIKAKGGAYVDSREVAKIIGKRHDHLLRDIGGYLKILAKSNLPNFGEIDFFVNNSYTDGRGRPQPSYLLSKMGCELVANKLTGAKGVAFTAAYVAKFNAMETAELEAAMRERTRPRLSILNAAVRNVLNGMAQSCAAPEQVMKFMTDIYEPLGIEVLPFHETDYYGYFTVTDIARGLGVYSESGRPHAHAVSAIISKIEDSPKHAMVIPYGLVGASFRYDTSLAMEVWDWLEKNRFPDEIPYLDFNYHVRYHCFSNPPASN